jgi:predicted amidohydrolase
VAVVQLDTGNDTDVNLQKIDACAREAAAHGAALVVFPERADYMGQGIRAHTAPIPGRVTESLAALSRDLGIYILCGTGEAQGEKNPWNALVLIDPEGQLISKYRKLHLFKVEGPDGVSVDESRFTEAGDEIITAKTDLGRLGLSICYDLRFPEMYRRMAQEGAEILCVPSDFTYATGKAHWEILLRARAIENTCYVIAANQCGQKPKYRAYGHSMIIDPWGRVLAEAGEKEEILYGEIDSQRLEEVRQHMPSLSNIREDIY